MSLIVLLLLLLFGLFFSTATVESEDSVVPGPPPAVAGSPVAAEGYAHPEWLVDPAWLMQHLDDPTVTVVALTPIEEFVAGHIPGAVQIDWPDLEVTDTSEPSIVRWQGEVEAQLTALGIAPADTVVIYDEGTLFAARLWWVLDQLGHADKRILNGGLPAWSFADGALATGPAVTEPAPEPYRGAPNPDVLAPLARVEASLGDPEVVLVNARTSDEYAVGHIPGAVNLNYPQNAEPEPPTVWRSAAELRALYADLGVTPDRTVIPYCTTGVRSAVTYFTLRLLGYDDVRLFTGSWAEWSAHPELPVTVGDQP